MPIQLLEGFLQLENYQVRQTGIAGATQMTFAAILGTFIIACGGDESFALCITIILILNCLAIYSSSVIHWNIVK